MPIAVAQSLVPTTAQAPLDARTVVAAVADIANIENPYVGLEVFVTATGKKYRIKTLTSTTVGTKTVYVVAADYLMLNSLEDESGLGLDIQLAQCVQQKAAVDARLADIQAVRAVVYRRTLNPQPAGAADGDGE